MQASEGKTATPLMAVSNTADKSFSVYDVADTIWDASTRLWYFKPVPEQGFSPDAIKAMGHGVGDLKLRDMDGSPAGLPRRASCKADAGWP